MTDKYHAIKALCPGAKFGVRNNEVIWNDEKIKQPTEEQVNNKIAELQNEEPMRLLREERNQKLQETDWWAAGDRIDSMTNEQKIYRKQLRDLPSTASPELDENGQLSNVTWPTKPE